MINIQKHGYGGIILPEYGIGLDVDYAVVPYVFISHAHADHVPRDRRTPVYATPATAALMKVRGFTGEVTELPFRETIDLGNGAFATLYPAGHILGSAMVYIQTPNGSVLYTGDYRTPPSPCTEGFECPGQVDYFITEATFSLPIYRWKPHEVLFDEIRQFAMECRSREEVPVFLTYNLGKAQEVMMALAPTQIPVQIHGAGYPLCEIYTQFGMQLGNYSRYDRETVAGGALITPSSSLDTSMITSIRNSRIAYVSGWASLESRRAQITVDKLIPLSDHVDFFELIHLCRKLRPRKVYITHTPNPDVVIHYLAADGIDAVSLDLAGNDAE
jgi:putative mRNA 3-end processing factor